MNALTDAQRHRALGGVIGPFAFVAAWSLGGLIAKNYSPVDDPISRLAAVGAPTRLLMTTGFVVFGIAVPIYARALRAALTGWSWATAAASGLTTLGVAAVPLGHSSSGDVVHGVCAGTGYVALAMTPFLAVGPLRRAGRSTFAGVSAAVAVASAFFLALSTVTTESGLFQRIGLTIVDVWIVTTAVEMCRPKGEGRRS